MAQGKTPRLRAIAATALLVKATEEIVTGSLLTNFIPHAIEAPLIYFVIVVVMHLIFILFSNLLIVSPCC